MALMRIATIIYDQLIFLFSVTNYRLCEIWISTIDRAFHGANRWLKQFNRSSYEVSRGK
jgi:hypothetical protein